MPSSPLPSDSPENPDPRGREPSAQDTDPPQSANLAINAWEGEYIEALYHQWALEPESVEPQWRQFFTGFELGYRPSIYPDSAADTIRRATALPAPSPAPHAPSAAPSAAPAATHSLQTRVEALIYQYRDIGHFAADLDPLGTRRPFPEDLTLQSLGLNESDLDQPVDPGALPLPNPSPLREVKALLDETYCRTIG